MKGLPLTPAQTLRLRYALAVGAPSQRVFYLNAANERAGYASSLRVAAASDRPFVVAVRDGLTAYDVDSEDAGKQVLRAIQRLETAGIPCAAWLSGRGLHAHLYVRNDCDESAEKIRNVVGQCLGGLAPRRHIRPPMSPHRLGLEMTLLYPGTDAEAVQALGCHLTALRPTEEGEAWRQSTLAQGWPKGSRSLGLQELARYYVRYGLSSCAFCSDVMSNPKGAGEKACGRRDGPRFLEAQYAAASRWLGENPEAWNTADDHEREIGEWQLRASQALLGHRSSLSQTIRGIAWLASCSGRTCLHLSVRDTSTAAGVCPDTVARHFRILCGLGWLVPVRGFQGTEAAIYRLSIAEAGNQTLRQHTPSKDSEQGVSEIMPLVNGAFWRKRAMRTVLMELIVSGAASLQELSCRMGRQPDTVRKHLAGLARLELVRYHDGLWHGCAEAKTLRRVANESGRGYGYENRCRANVLQQEGWRRYCDGL